MAPSSSDALKTVEGQVQGVIQTLYEICVGVQGFQGPESTEAIANTIDKLTTQFNALDRTRQTLDVAVPPEVVTYVEDGRNPDIYTREFVELVAKENQHMKGKIEAYRDFRDVLADEIDGAFPELKGEVEKILQGTGGRRRGVAVREAPPQQQQPLARPAINGVGSGGA